MRRYKTALFWAFVIIDLLSELCKLATKET